MCVISMCFSFPSFEGYVTHFSLLWQRTQRVVVRSRLRRTWLSWAESPYGPNRRKQTYVYTKGLVWHSSLDTKANKQTYVLKWNGSTEGFGEENYFILDFASLRSTLIFFYRTRIPTRDKCTRYVCVMWASTWLMYFTQKWRVNLCTHYTHVRYV